MRREGKPSKPATPATDSGHPGRSEALDAVLRVVHTVHRSLQIREVAERAVEAITTYTPFAGGAMFTLDEGAGDLELVASRGFSPEVVDTGRRLPLEGSLVGQAVREGRVIVTDDLSRERRGLESLRRVLVRDGFTRALIVPLLHGDERLGSLNLVVHEGYELTEGERETLEAIGQTIALALVNARYVERLRLEVRQRERVESERRRLQEQLLAAEKARSLGVLAGGAAHDFNNLLTTILGNADLARRRTDVDGEIRPLLDRITEAADRAGELTRQLLAYSGRASLVMQPVDLSVLVATTGKLLRPNVPEGATLCFESADGSLAIHGDPGQLRQVVANLIANACEALEPGGGTILLRTGTRARHATIEVRDDGCGMQAEVRERMFEPFFTTKFTGRGLGLAAVQGIVRAHSGDLIVDTAPGQGTRVVVSLPLSSPATTTTPDLQAVSPSDSAGGTILVVDDEEAVRTLAADVLRQAGYAVLTAGDGHEAVELFRGQADRIRLVLLDLTMPRMDGSEAMREMLAIRPDLRVILSSGYADTDDARQRPVPDSCAWLAKPYRPDSLLEEVRRSLGA